MKIMSNDKRVQPGVPTGGEFAAHKRAEGGPLFPEVGYGIQKPDESGALTPEQIAMNVYVGIHSFPWLVHGDPMRELLARGAQAGIEYERARASAAPQPNDDGRLAAAHEALRIHDSGTLSFADSETGERWATGDKLADALRGLMKVQPPVDFKPEGHSDEYRREWESLDNNDDEPFEMQIGASNVMLATPDQARRILAMLSAESDE